MSDQAAEIAPNDRRDDEYELDPDLVAAVVESSAVGDRVAVLSLIDGLHNADIADLLEQIGGDDRRAFIDLVWADIDNEVLTDLSERVRDDVIEFEMR